jgi:hypothetical protein
LVHTKKSGFTGHTSYSPFSLQVALVSQFTSAERTNPPAPFTSQITIPNSGGKGARATNENVLFCQS